MILIPTILSGGVGSRLWPISRDLHPKPFIKMNDGQSLLQKAFLRSITLPNVQEVLTVTNQELLFKTREEFKSINNTNKIPLSLILEPFGRNTAAAIAMAAIHIQKKYGNDAIMLVLSADHIINDQLSFHNAVHDAIHFANKNKLVTLGVQPTSAETAYGYIKSNGNDVLNFIEKPSLDKAQEYIKNPNYLWNAGIFCFTTKNILEQMQIHCANILNASKICFHHSKYVESFNINQLELNEIEFAKIPDQSIDYAVMEHSKNIAVIPCNIGWSDLGSWKALSEMTPADEKQNRIQGTVFTHNSKDNYISTQGRVVGAVGVNNLIIIDTQDALLVASKDQSQDVKHIYAQLKLQNHDAHKLHRTIVRPWGTYTILEEGPGFKIKRIVVNPKASLSLQMHIYRSEHWIVVSGEAIVTNGNDTSLIKTNESTYIPAGNKHRLTNNTDQPTVIIEVQSGNYLGEDDIIRFEDVYGRVPT